MNSLNQKCSLCQSYLIQDTNSQATFNCPKCPGLEFIIFQDIVYSQSYRFKDDDIFSLSFMLQVNQTCIQLTYDSPLKSKNNPIGQININEIWPDTQAKDALHLAKQLLKLKAFY